MKQRTRVTPGSGNVFADLGLADPEERLAKAELAATIDGLLTLQGLRQTETATLLGIDQPSVSRLSRGKLAGFSLERLIGFLRTLQQDVEIRVTAAPRRRTGRLVVSAKG